MHLKKIDIKVTPKKSFVDYLKRNEKVRLGEKYKNASSPKGKK